MKIAKRVSAREYAEMIGVHEDTVQAWCRKASDRTMDARKRPPIAARKMGRSWAIDVEKTEQAMSIAYGTVAERDAALREAREIRANRLAA